MLKSRVLLIFVPQPYALRSSRVLRTTYLLLSVTPAVDHHAAQQRVHRIVPCYSVSSLRLCHVHSSALLSPRQSQGDAAPRRALKSKVLLMFVPQPYALRSSRVLRTTYLLLSETLAVDHHAARGDTLGRRGRAADSCAGAPGPEA